MVAVGHRGVFDKKTLLISSLVLLASVAFILLFSNSIRANISTLIFAGMFARWMPVTILIFAILWRIYEVVYRWHFGKERAVRFTETLDRRICDWKTFIYACIASVVVLQFGVLGAQVGIIQYDGMLDRHGAALGIMPFSDAKQYYASSISIPFSGFMGGTAARRPVHVSILSFLTMIGSYDRVSILLLQATFVGVPLGIATVILARVLGLGLALAVWGIVIIEANDHVAGYMSEPSGFWLGTAAAAVLLTSIRNKSKWIIPLAIGLLMFAFSARAGAMLLLPALVIIGIFYSIHNNYSVTKYFLILTVCIVPAIIFPALMYRLNDTNGSNFQGNFSLVLYELAVDGEHWTQARRDLPELKEMPLPTQSGYIYKKAFEALIDSPLSFVKAYAGKLAVAAIEFPGRHISGVMRSIINGPFNRPLWSAAILFYGGLIWLIVGSVLSTRVKLSVLLLVLAYSASIPFIWINGGFRFHAATWILTAILLAGLLARPTATGESVKDVKITLAFAIFIYGFLIFSAVIPALAASMKEYTEWPKRRNAVDDDGKMLIEYHLMLGSHTPVLHIVRENRKHIRPRVGIEEFRRSKKKVGQPDVENFFGGVKPGTTIFIGVSTTGVHRFYVSDHFTCIPIDNTVVRVVGEWINSPYTIRIRQMEYLNSQGENVPLSTMQKDVGCL